MRQTTAWKNNDSNVYNSVLWMTGIIGVQDHTACIKLHTNIHGCFDRQFVMRSCLLFLFQIVRTHMYLFHVFVSCTNALPPQPFQSLSSSIAGEVYPDSYHSMSTITNQEVEVVTNNLEAAMHRAEQSDKDRTWYAGTDADLAFPLLLYKHNSNRDGEACRINVYIADMYTSMHADFLKQLRVDVVVNMMGQPDLLNQEQCLYGPRCHYEEDKHKYEAYFNKAMTENRLAQASEYLRGPYAFYARLGIQYVEHGVADESHNSVKDIFPTVCKDVHNALEAVFSAQRDNPTASVMFHCYGGRNRSAAALLAFVHSVFLRQGEAVPSMEKLLLVLAEMRPKILTRARQAHTNFIENLLQWEVMNKEIVVADNCEGGDTKKTRK